MGRGGASVLAVGLAYQVGQVGIGLRALLHHHQPGEGFHHLVGEHYHGILLRLLACMVDKGRTLALVEAGLVISLWLLLPILWFLLLVARRLGVVGLVDVGLTGRVVLKLGFLDGSGVRTLEEEPNNQCGDGRYKYQ